VVDPVRREGVQPIRLAGGGQHGGAQVVGQRGGGEAERGGAAPDQQALPGPQVQPGRQRPVRGLQRLRDAAEHRPRQVGPERDHVPARHHGVFGVAAVVSATHPAHQRGHLLAGAQIAAGCGIHRADRLDTGHDREPHPVGQAAPQVKFGAVEPERLHRDPHPARSGLRDRQVADLEVVHRPGLAEHDGAHR